MLELSLHDVTKMAKCQDSVGVEKKEVKKRWRSVELYKNREVEV